MHLQVLHRYTVKHKTSTTVDQQYFWVCSTTALNRAYIDTFSVGYDCFAMLINYHFYGDDRHHILCHCSLANNVLLIYFIICTTVDQQYFWVCSTTALNRAYIDTFSVGYDCFAMLINYHFYGDDRHHILSHCSLANNVLLINFVICTVDLHPVVHMSINKHFC